MGEGAVVVGLVTQHLHQLQQILRQLLVAGRREATGCSCLALSRASAAGGFTRLPDDTQAVHCILSHVLVRVVEVQKLKRVSGTQFGPDLQQRLELRDRFSPLETSHSFGQQVNDQTAAPSPALLSIYLG